MQLHALHLTLNDADVAAALPKAFEQVQQISDPQVNFEAGKLIFKGKFKAGILPVPFQAHCELTAEQNGEVLAVRLAKVQAAFFSGGGEAIISALAKQLPPTPGLTTAGDKLLLNIAQLLAARGARLSGKIHELTLKPGSLTIRFGE